MLFQTAGIEHQPTQTLVAVVRVSTKEMSAGCALAAVKIKSAITANPTLRNSNAAGKEQADIEGSESNVAMSARRPQASYPCGKFSDTSLAEHFPDLKETSYRRDLSAVFFPH